MNKSLIADGFFSPALLIAKYECEDSQSVYLFTTVCSLSFWHDYDT